MKKKKVRNGPADSSSTLTAREREVLRLEARGFSYKLIAAQLRISEHTVNNHLYNARQKLGARSAFEAIQCVWPLEEDPPRGLSTPIQ